jgi:hypothetical protein
LKETVRSTDPALTRDFLAFFDFSDRVDVPKEPGPGYLITRYYIDGKRETAFDQLHYYPDTGLVYYDGIVNGESEYDGEWYTANPEIKVVFESVLVIQTGSGPGAEKKEPIPFASQPQPDSAKAPSQSASVGLSSFSITVAAIATGLIALFAFALRRRKPLPQ